MLMAVSQLCNSEVLNSGSLHVMFGAVILKRGFPPNIGLFAQHIAFECRTTQVGRDHQDRVVSLLIEPCSSSFVV